VSEKQKQRQRGFYNGRKDLLRTGKRERNSGRKGGRLRERDVGAHTSYSCSVDCVPCGCVFISQIITHGSDYYKLQCTCHQQ